jgi:putative endonuclease
VGSNPTLSAERCWSGLTGTPGERVSGFPDRGFESHPLRQPALRLRLASQICYVVHIYIEDAIDNKLYIGSTNDITRRLTEHNSGKVDSTKNRTPLRLEVYFAVKDKARAITLEQYFKTGSGRAFLQKRII